MGLRGLGHPLFAIGIAGLGVVSLVSGDFAYIWQPAPSWAAGQPVFAYASGALMLVCGAGLLWRRTLPGTAVALAIYGLASIVLIHTPRLVNDWKVEAEWFNLGEIATFIAGAWLLFAAASTDSMLGGQRAVRSARVVFALSLLAFGLSHFVYSKQTAAMVPPYLPEHLTWAYFTGAAHLAAGLGILFGIAPRLAATLEALMLSIFDLTVNLPDLINKGARAQWQWAELCIATAIAGVAFLVAGSYLRDRWLAIQRPGT